MMMTVLSSTLLLYLHGPLHSRQLDVQAHALAALLHWEPWMMTTSASLTLLPHLRGTLRPRVQHLGLLAPVLSLDVFGPCSFSR